MPQQLTILDQAHELGDEARRLVHGRGRRHPGWEHVAIDWFPPVILVTFYEERGANAQLLGALAEARQRCPGVAAIVVQDRHLRGAPKRTLWGELPGSPTASESGLRYQLALDRNQNHGFFLDMKPGRDWIRAGAAGKRVLNLFAYTCSLSVAAIAGGAEAVTNLDMAGGALATGRRNHQQNFDPATCRRAGYLAHDLFKSWGKLRRSGPYDLIAIDPPSNQPGSFVAEGDYAKIARRLPELTHPESKILACLNSPHLGEVFLREVFAGYGFAGRLPAAPGFADTDAQRGLKCLIFSV